MRRVAIALGIVAILASSCGGDQLPARLATSLENRVASIRGYAESGRPGLARSALRNLVVLVTAQVEAGRIDEARATEILAAAQAVADQLVLVPRSSPSETPSPSPIDEGDEDKGNGKGHGDEGHGNDD
jgi:hypothetical protein